MFSWPISCSDEHAEEPVIPIDQHKSSENVSSCVV